MADHFRLDMSREEINAVSVLGLAHVGDAVYELMVRSWLCASGTVRSDRLHRRAVALVSAAAQAAMAEKCLPLLSEEELAGYRRGRNAKVNSVPHHARVSDYHMATGLEALFGWLYLQGRLERLDQLFDRMTEEDHAS